MQQTSETGRAIEHGMTARASARTYVLVVDDEQDIAGLIKHKMFPELWSVRTDLTELAKQSD